VRWVSRDVGWSKRELSGLVSTLQLCREATEGKASTLPTEKDYFNFAESKREAEESAQSQRRILLCLVKASASGSEQRGPCAHTATT
jgi:hypothetical protein